MKSSTGCSSGSTSSGSRPDLLVDVGCGVGHGLRALAQRFPAAMPVGVDAALPMLAQAQRLSRRAQTLAGRLQRLFGGGHAGPAGTRLVCADAAALPLAESGTDLLWSCLAWHWFTDPPAVAAEWYRVLRPEGLLMFSAFGVDTFTELRALGATLPEFPDMHDVGDLLAQAGFGDPVLDTERLTVTCASRSGCWPTWRCWAATPRRPPPRADRAGPPSRLARRGRIAARRRRSDPAERGDRPCARLVSAAQAPARGLRADRVPPAHRPVTRSSAAPRAGSGRNGPANRVQCGPAVRRTRSGR